MSTLLHNDTDRGSVFRELGVRTVINAHNTLTGLGGNLPDGPVLDALRSANEAFVEVRELSDAVGDAIADMLGIEAALVTPGAAAAAVLASAACITAGADEAVSRIPDTTGLPNEFVVPAGHRTFYDRCLEGAGGKIVLAGSEDLTTTTDLENAISERTAGMFFYAPGFPNVPTFEEILSIAKRNALPLIVDAAEQVYPTDGFSKYVQAGADFATYSGKFFGGVSMTGILTGTVSGIEAARRNSYIAFEGPNAEAFGRHMKVGRTELVAAYAALKHWLDMDHEARFEGYERKMEVIRSKLEEFAFLSFSFEDGSVTPDNKPPDTLRVTFDLDHSPKSLGQVVQELHSGEPCIILRPHYEWVEADRDYMDIRVLPLSDGQEEVIADRLVEILSE